MRFFFILLIPFFLQSCKQTGRKYYIIIDVEKAKVEEGYPKSYSVIDSAFFASDTAAAWEGIRRKWSIIKENKAPDHYDGTYKLNLLDETQHDVFDRLSDSFKDRLGSYVPEQK